jgi:hypothetical protein
MARERLTFRQRDVTAAIKAVERAGYSVASVSITRDGSISVELKSPDGSGTALEREPNPWVEVPEPPKETQLEKWAGTWVLRKTDGTTQSWEVRRVAAGLYRMTLNDESFAEVRRQDGEWLAEVRSTKTNDVIRRTGTQTTRDAAVAELINSLM